MPAAPDSQPPGQPASRDEQFDLLLRNAREYAIFLMDRDARITSWNVGAENLLGWTAEEACGELGEIVFTDEQRAADVPTYELATARREGQAEDQRWHQRKDGSRFWANGMMIALYDADGAVRGFAKILRDNTQEKAYRETLEDLNRTLEARVAEQTARVRALAASLAAAEADERRRISDLLHDDLQQRLYAIFLSTEGLVRELGETDHAARAQQLRGWAEETVALARRLASDLLTPGGDSDRLADGLEDLGRQVEALHGLRVHRRLDPDVTVPDEGVRVLLLQAVRELLFNVVKHAGTDEATLSMQSVPEGVQVRVEDEGRGFDVEHARGPSLGLKGVRQRLALVGGAAEVEGTVGSGTRVTLTVPSSPDRSVLRPHRHVP